MRLRFAMAKVLSCLMEAVCYLREVCPDFSSRWELTLDLGETLLVFHLYLFEWHLLVDLLCLVLGVLHLMFAKETGGVANLKFVSRVDSIVAVFELMKKLCCY